MNRKLFTVGGLAILAIIIAAIIVFWPSSHHPQNDARSDCWAHADSHGRRHCAT